MHQVLITGATGFVGSALAASLLARGAHVTVLSRNDPDGVRTVTAVVAAAIGCGLDINGALNRYLKVINIDFAELETALTGAELGGITEVWHVAAEMSYSAHKLGLSFDTNVGNSTRLYEAVLRLAPLCRRFYYVSTAYVAGMTGGPVHEELHAKSRMLNTYQVTKWSTEQALHLLYLRCGLPVTVFRPTVVVGHRATGWAHRNGFGFYMFQDAMSALAKAGHKELTLDLLEDTRPDLVPIDQLTADACSLTLRQHAGRDFEVFHSAGGIHLPMREVVRIWGEVTGIDTCLGAPTTALEQKFDRAVGANKPFARTEWRFDRSKLDAATGGLGVQPLSSEELYGLCSWYADESIDVTDTHEDAVAKAG